MNTRGVQYIYNGNTPTKALEFNAICGTKDQCLIFQMVYKNIILCFSLTYIQNFETGTHTAAFEIFSR